MFVNRPGDELGEPGGRGEDLAAERDAGGLPPVRGSRGASPGAPHAARRRRPGALGFRDILDDAATFLGEWRAGDFTEQAEIYYDERLLAYGDARVLDFVEEYRLPEALAARTRYSVAAAAR